jgi:hypothetical protein
MSGPGHRQDRAMQGPVSRRDVTVARVLNAPQFPRRLGQPADPFCSSPGVRWRKKAREHDSPGQEVAERMPAVINAQARACAWLRHFA